MINKSVFMKIFILFLTVCAPHIVQAQTSESLKKIDHIIVIIEENRSFNNMFGLFPGANGIFNAGAAAHQVARDGRVYKFLPPIMNTHMKPAVVDTRFPAEMANAPFLIDAYVPQNQATGDLVHRFYQEKAQISNGKMDRFAVLSNAGGLVMGYYDTSKTVHWKLAKEYALGDAMFHSAFGGSFLNHTYLVCGCAYKWPNAADHITAKLDSEGGIIRDGQVSPEGFAINTSRSVNLHAPNDDPARLVPQQTMPHIGDLLDAKNISWKWYAGGYDDAVAGKPAKLFQFHHQPFAYFQNLAPGTAAQKAHLQDLKDLYADIEKNTLPAVSFYKPIGELNLHPGYANVTDGDQHLGDLIERLKKMPSWDKTLVIITYDEHGGFWDHVAPPKRDFWGPGTRVPLIVVGEMVKKGFIDSTQYDFGSILKTIEERFGLPSLNDHDGKAKSMVNFLQ